MKPVQDSEPVVDVAVAFTDLLCDLVRSPAFSHETFVAAGLGDGVYADVSLKVFNKPSQKHCTNSTAALTRHLKTDLHPKR